MKILRYFSPKGFRHDDRQFRIIFLFTSYAKISSKILHNDEQFYLCLLKMFVFVGIYE